jgi:hypothetical protein
MQVRFGNRIEPEGVRLTGSYTFHQARANSALLYICTIRRHARHAWLGSINSRNCSNDIRRDA